MTDFFEDCLRAVRHLIRTEGWCQSFAQWKLRAPEDHAVHLTEAIEVVAHLWAPQAAVDAYPELDSPLELAAEMKAYLVTMTPRRAYAPHDHLTLDQFNDLGVMTLEQMSEFLDCAIEAYRPAQTGYRHRYAMQQVPGLNIYTLAPSSVRSTS